VCSQHGFGRGGIELQNASVVINCDLPWNPPSWNNASPAPGASIDPRWSPSINLVSEKTIEHRMLDTLSNKQALADGVLDRIATQRDQAPEWPQPSWPNLQQLVVQPAGVRNRGREPNHRCLPTAPRALPLRRAGVLTRSAPLRGALPE